jgi:hypothetical protein
LCWWVMKVRLACRSVVSKCRDNVRARRAVLL